MWQLLFSPPFQSFVIALCLYQAYRLERNAYYRAYNRKRNEALKKGKPVKPPRSVAENERIQQERWDQDLHKSIARLQKRIRRYRRLEELAKQNGTQIKRLKELRRLSTHSQEVIVTNQKKLGIYKGQEKRPALPDGVESSDCSALCNVHPSSFRVKRFFGSFSREQVIYHGGLRQAGIW